MNLCGSYTELGDLFCPHSLTSRDCFSRFAALKDRFLSDSVLCLLVHYHRTRDTLWVRLLPPQNRGKNYWSSTTDKSQGLHVSIFRVRKIFCWGFLTPILPHCSVTPWLGHLWEGPVVFNWPFAYSHFILCLFISLLMSPSTFTNT